MEQLPVYIGIVFILTALLSFLLLLKAGKYSKPLIVILVLWLGLQAILGLTGFYKVTTGIPPRFALLLVPPVVFILMLFFTRKGKGAIDSFNVPVLTLMQIVRVMVEVCLFWLYLHHAVPVVMTFEGRNLDILCGLTAPFIYYFGYIKNVLNPKVLIAWNIICLLLLFNIVITAVLSAPFAFQKFGFEQPNIALFYFPFVWLPGFVVPAALFGHLVALRRLLGYSSEQ